MDTDQIKTKFEKMGARVKVDLTLDQESSFRWRREASEESSHFFTIDIQKDKKGEYFYVKTFSKGAPEVVVMDLQKEDRHLLLMAKKKIKHKKVIQKFLCGHDERFWFVAPVPESAGASTVKEAMEALKPDAVKNSQVSNQVKTRDKNKRKNAGFLRQGEWFFIPCPELKADEKLILNNEPIRRGSGKPHMVEFLYRSGGETVYISEVHPEGITEKEYKIFLRKNPHQKLNWKTMTLVNAAYAKGKIKHPDHKTIELPLWHQISLNTEGHAQASGSVKFLD